MSFQKKLFQLGPITLETKEKSGNSSVSLLPKLGALKKSLCAKAPFPGGRGATTTFRAREEEEKRNIAAPWSAPPPSVEIAPTQNLREVAEKKKMGNEKVGNASRDKVEKEQADSRDLLVVLYRMPAWKKRRGGNGV